MTIDISILEQRYIDSCRRHGVPPNTAILSGVFKSEVKRSGYQLCKLDIFLDQLKDIDFLPLLEVCMKLDSSDIEAVDVRNESSCMLSGENALSLMRAIGGKLRKVDLHDLSFGKDFLRDLSQRGLSCQVLTLKSSHFRKLNLVGEFSRIHSLNLDFSTSLTTFREDCFACMPNLRFLSLCETRISNLWTTLAALSKLPSLMDLRFQHWLCCNENVPCSHGSRSDNSGDFCQPSDGSDDGHPYIDPNLSTGKEIQSILSLKCLALNRDVLGVIEDSSDDSELDFSNHSQEFGSSDVSSNCGSWWNGQSDLQEVSPDIWSEENEERSTMSAYTRQIADVSLRYISHNASPICFEKHYREYMIASLPNLKVLDNLPIGKIDREKAISTYSQYFQYLPYQRKHKESLVQIIQNREIKASHSRLWSSKQKISDSSRKSQSSYARSLCASKMGSSNWPFLRPLSAFSRDLGDGGRRFRPRQFEYHPSDPSLMAFGTLDGEVVVVNHENEKIVSYMPSSIGEMNCVLGLCWLKNHPSKLIGGSDNGSLKLYDIRHEPRTFRGIYSIAGLATFEGFNQLTSVHVNSTDELFLASGYSKNVALYDISTGRLLQVFNDMHREHINVVKFANHSPSIFATSSFDQDIKMWDLRQRPLLPCYTSSSSRGNVMVCFSPDDHFLLASAVDNEVKQLLAVDGRLHLNFDISPTGSSQNYTRSYYMNGRDYIISGSCDEHVVRICCTQTGKHLRDISLEGKGGSNTMFVQSLRGDPFREFNMSILAAYVRPSSRSEIVKVNLLASNEQANEFPKSHLSQPLNQKGG